MRKRKKETKRTEDDKTERRKIHDLSSPMFISFLDVIENNKKIKILRIQSAEIRPSDSYLINTHINDRKKTKHRIIYSFYSVKILKYTKYTYA